MNEINLYLLLEITNKNSSAIRLTRRGVSFSEIATQTQRCIEKGLMVNNHNMIELSDTGIKLLEDLEKKFKNINKNEWIEKDFKNKIERIDKSIIFVPRQSELNF